MDCQDAQRIISEALDGEQVAPATVREAKEHCAGCPSCLGYVKTLAAAHRAPLPQPPADLADRVMARVRKEADEIAVKQAYAAAAAAVAAESAVTGAVAGGYAEGDASSAQPLPENAPVDVKALWARLKRPENRRTVVIWAGAAAMLLVFVGVVGIAGVNAILGGRGTEATSASKQTAAYDSGAAQESAPQVATPDTSRDSSSTDQGSVAGAPAPSASYIVAAGSVYRLVGPNTYARSNLTTGGTTTSSLGSPDPPKSLAYYLAPEKNRVVLDDGTANLLVFELVTRDFAGRQFALRSGDITSYRAWPTMPPPMQPPANADGAPQFQPAGTSMGVPAFVQAGTTAEAGIAIGPNTPATDPAGGNPNWTWWTPRK